MHVLSNLLWVLLDISQLCHGQSIDQAPPPVVPIGAEY